MTFKYRGTPGSLLASGLIGRRTVLYTPAGVLATGPARSLGLSLSGGATPRACDANLPVCPVAARPILYALPAPREPLETPDPPRVRALVPA